MRDPNRIDSVLAAIREVWVQHPDMRLGQLIVNAVQPASPNVETFHTEDFPLVTKLENLQKRLADTRQDSSDQFCSIETLNEITGPDFRFASFDGWSLAIYASVTDYPHSWYAKLGFHGVSFIDCPSDFSHAKFRAATDKERSSVGKRTPIENGDLIVSVDAESMASIDQQTFFIVCESVSLTRKAA